MVMRMSCFLVPMNVRVFLFIFAFMVMFMMPVIVNVCMFVKSHFMNMVMLMLLTH